MFARPFEAKQKGRQVSPVGPSVSCSGSALTGHFSSQIAGAYLRDQSYWGTAPNRARCSSGNRTDATDKPPLQDGARLISDSLPCKAGCA